MPQFDKASEFALEADSFFWLQALNVAEIPTEELEPLFLSIIQSGQIPNALAMIALHNQHKQFPSYADATEYLLANSQICATTI